ncbi:MAG TPA: MaoC/PaaZ C-terminal domain-containing protein [Planctomycetota bacterium]|nr:MaoC/PaaZ C-terminal domain-containing protein [Planctomycetota bacterium]
MDTGAQAPGKTFDDLSLGDTFVSPSRTLDQGHVVSFAELSGDSNPVHLDEVFARSTLFRGRIAHGLLIQSIASGLAWQTGVFRGTIVALAEMTMRFEAPVRPGDTIRVELSVLAKDPSPGPRRGHVRWRTRVQNQKDETVIDGEWLTLLHRARAPRRNGEESTK